MPIEFFTSLERDLVYARWWGSIDSQTRYDNFSRYLSDVHYKPGRDELIDVSGVTETDWDYSRAAALLRRVNAQKPGTLVQTRTVVWAPDDLTYGCARMLQTLAEMASGISVEIYRSETCALGAYDLPYSTIQMLLEEEIFLPHAPREVTQT